MCVAILGAVSFLPAAQAGGPRFISGSGWGVGPGNAVGWGATSLLYYTDPGDLSATVSHAQADTMVAAAAAVWNVPTSSISLTHGGELAEHLTTQNTYFDGEAMVFPPDVQTSNEANIPVAIVYDTDGSVTDLLLGEGASEPDACRENAVVGDVDDIHTSDGQIHHATLILNGRCVGSAPEQLTQMQYQLARAFGRILGLSWAQTNDNVFTAQSTVTAHQVAYWPLMHPIDVICGNYSYQCMTDPFTLRVDDLNALASLYRVPASNVPAGKQATSGDALWLYGMYHFPTNQGMGWVNFTASRQNNGLTEDWETASGISGSFFQQSVATPLAPSAAENSGTEDGLYEGYLCFGRIPLNGVSNVFLTSEPINPLYVGSEALGPYVRPPASPSGSPQTIVDWSAMSPGDLAVGGPFGAGDAASSCSPGNDGTETAPATLDPSGWQDGLLCGWGHSSWWSASIAPGHTWTLEVTATDETGSASTYKAQPVVGVWNVTDAPGTMPTVANEPVAFNSMAFGVTQLQMGDADTQQALRFSITDQFGAGRPDFTYTARLLYAATVAPATISADGGRITITGTGFRQGNQVLVNGVTATVESWTSTQIVADAPTIASAEASVGVPVSVAVTDAATGGSSEISAGISYTAGANTLQEVSAPSALLTGVTAAVPFAVRVLASDGVTPVAGAGVRFTVTAGSALLGVCGTQTTCTATSDSNGLVQSTVTGEAPGNITLTATELSGTSSVQVTVADTTPSRYVGFSETARYVAAGAAGTWTLQLTADQNGIAAAAASVTWTVTPGLTIQASDSVTGSGGTAGITVSAGSIASGSVETLTGCVWSSLCATWTVYGVDPSQWQVTAISGGTQSVRQGASLSAVGLAVSDLAGHPLQGALVTVHQRVLGWESSCPVPGRCASAPVLASSQASVTSDASGSVPVTPLQLPGMPQVVEIAVSAGTEGFLTLTLVKAP